MNKYHGNGKLYSESELRSRSDAFKGTYIWYGYTGHEHYTLMGRIDPDTMDYVRREPMNYGRNAAKREARNRDRI